MTYNLSKAIQISQKVHEGQMSMYDDRKSFYDEHPFKVMRMVRKSCPDHHKIRYEMVAILHDVIEDTKWTLDSLRELGIPKDIIEAVDLLTHKQGVSYSDYLIPIKTNELARRVKVADMLSNMTFFYMYNREYKMNKYIDGLKYLITNEVIQIKNIRDVADKIILGCNECRLTDNCAKYDHYMRSDSISDNELKDMMLCLWNGNRFICKHMLEEGSL